MAETYDLLKSIPNKVINDDGSVTDITGNPVNLNNSVLEYKMHKALPNKVLNPDGTYSTLSDIIGGGASGDLFIVVEELPQEGEPNKIYLVPKDDGGFYEYTYINNSWDEIGDLDIDINNYPTINMMNNAINNAYNNAMNYTNNALANYVPLREFPNTFITNQNTPIFFNSIINSGVTVGSYYLGLVELTDMPEGLIQAEVQVSVYPNDILYATMRSADLEPYVWEANSFDYAGWENFTKTVEMNAQSYTDNAINNAIGNVLNSNF